MIEERSFLILAALVVLVAVSPALAITGEFCVNPGVPILDDSAVSATGTLIVADAGTIDAADPLAVGIEITHTWVGDLSVRLTHVDTGTSALLIDRIHGPGLYCSGNDIDVLLFDAAPFPVETACNALVVPSVSGNLSPNNPLSVFNGESMNGRWTLSVVDHAAGDVGTLDVFCLNGPEGGTTTGGTPTPASSGWSVAILIGLVLVVSWWFLHRPGASRA